jgi:hypothetical protein
MKHPSFVLAGALALALAGAADAQALVTRSSTVFGNFVVGYASVLDTGAFNEVLNTLDGAYDQSQADAGSANGTYNNLPVAGTAGFAVEQIYDVSAGLISGSGYSATSGSTPYGHVSVGANGQSFMRLRFTVPTLMAYTLTGEVQRGLGAPTNGVAPSAQAIVQLSGTGTCCGGLFDATNTPGAFSISGLISPQATAELYASATSRLNGEGSYWFNLVLTPVPEPAAWLLLALGAPALLWRRLRAGQRQSQGLGHAA